MGQVSNYARNVCNSLRKPIIRKLWLEITEHCQSRCSICNKWKNKAPVDLQVNDLVRFLDAPEAKHIDYIINSGGEPVLSSQFHNILFFEHALFPKATLQISTNGIAVDKVLSAVQYALQLGAKIDVGISLDGVGEDHDKIRGVKGNFQKVDALVTKFTELCNPNLNVGLGATLTTTTARYVDKLLEYAESKSVSISWNWMNLSFYYDNLDMKIEVDKDLFTEAITKVIPSSTYRDMWIASLNGKLPKFSCYALRSFLAIRADGAVVPCLSKWTEVVGYIQKQSLREILHSFVTKSEFEAIKNCVGCLNSWGWGWSIRSNTKQLLKIAVKKVLS